MAPRTCPFCKKTRVHHEATICPYCRSKIEQIPLEPMPFGKTAFSAYFAGEELGKIENVTFSNKGTRLSQWYYVVNREGRMYDCPINSVVVKDVPSTKAKYQKPITGRVDESLKGVASEFSVFLAKFNGQLNNLYIENQNMFVDWDSEK